MSKRKKLTELSTEDLAKKLGGDAGHGVLWAAVTLGYAIGWMTYGLSPFQPPWGIVGFLGFTAWYGSRALIEFRLLCMRLGKTYDWKDIRRGGTGTEDH